MILRYIVDEETEGKNIKYILKNKLELSERLVKKLKYNTRILCNSSPVFVNAIVKNGDIVEADIEFEEECSDIIPQDIKIDIIYEDDFLIILNKQPNIVVHPTFNHPTGTIANAIMYHLKAKGITKKIRPVSRLDRDTSGIIIFAKNEFIQESLIHQMNDKLFSKEYIGVVHGKVLTDSGTINLPIGRKPDSIMLRHVSPDGDNAITHFKVLERFRNATYLSFLLETGRTHQIRVHCQAIGHPLIGDTLYTYEDIPLQLYACINNNSMNNHLSNHQNYHISRQALHSYKVRFTHPFLKHEMELIAPTPHDILSLLEILGN